MAPRDRSARVTELLTVLTGSTEYLGVTQIDDKGLGQRLRRGNSVTLVLGAGVSCSRGLPSWYDLLRKTWQAVFNEDPYAMDMGLLERARKACAQAGIPQQFVDRLDIQHHPLEPQFGFERIYNALRWSIDDEKSLERFGKRRARRLLRIESNEQRVAELFVGILRDTLYRGIDRPHARNIVQPDTLALVARAVRRNAKRPRTERRIAQVITFNVDDLLEREVNVGCRRRIPWAVPIYRASAMRPVPSPRSIAIYHLHGFVPLKSSSYPLYMEDGRIGMNPAAESLVFTDEQYWRLIANPGDFASRVFLGALSGTCVFLGLSMTDINLLRWLANDAIERSDDFRRLARGWSSSEADFSIIEELSRHYWITTGTAVDEGAEHVEPDLLTSTLSRRGVDRIIIPGWQSEVFHTWWQSSFNP